MREDGHSGWRGEMTRAHAVFTLPSCCPILWRSRDYRFTRFSPRPALKSDHSGPRQTRGPSSRRGDLIMVRKGRAVWRGTGKDGTGDLTTDSGVLSSTPYSFKTRFESEQGTNPEELIAAARAGCFTMALAFQLQGAGFHPDRTCHRG